MLKITPEKCQNCGGCVSLCRFNALVLSSAGLKLIPQKCTLCLDCVTFCPVRALEPRGV